MVEVSTWYLRSLPDTSYPIERAVLNLPDFADGYLKWSCGELCGAAETRCWRQVK